VDEVTARVKKWGSSLGVVIPAPVARRQRLRPGDKVRIKIEAEVLRVCDITGMLAPYLKNFDLKAALKELETGWEDE
jgi:antitoxin component of MazEF toxin-antitoxin module